MVRVFFLPLSISGGSQGALVSRNSRWRSFFFCCNCRRQRPLTLTQSTKERLEFNVYMLTVPLFRVKVVLLSVYRWRMKETTRTKTPNYKKKKKKIVGRVGVDFRQGGAGFPASEFL